MKRRAITGSEIPFDQSLLSGITQEPPSKKAKYQQLYEASVGDPDKLLARFTQTQTVTDSSLGVSQSLTVLREEEEGQEDDITSQPEMPSLKRKVEHLDSDIEEDPCPVATNVGASDESGHIAKKMAIENVNAVENTGLLKTTVATKTAGTGAAAGKPDTDHAFLKALASLKRGRKHEDEFDRDFNNLRIAKPDLNRSVKTEDEPEKSWALLDDFGTDVGLRGNFMVVRELDVWRDSVAGQERCQRRVAQQPVQHPLWEGVPNFKKFKKVRNPCLIEVFGV